MEDRVAATDQRAEGRSVGQVAGDNFLAWPGGSKIRDVGKADMMGQGRQIRSDKLPDRSGGAGHEQTIDLARPHLPASDIGHVGRHDGHELNICVERQAGHVQH